MNNETVKAWVSANLVDVNRNPVELYKEYTLWLRKRKLKIQPVTYVSFKMFVQNYSREQLVQEIEEDVVVAPEPVQVEEPEVQVVQIVEPVVLTSTSSPIEVEEVSEEEIFQQIEDYTASVCDPLSTDYALIISGDPGLGKTVSVTKVLLEKLGPQSEARQFFVEEDLPEGVVFETLSQEEEIQEGNLELTWIEGSTKISPQNLYLQLYRENGKVIVFDDADSLIENPGNFDILKRVLDSKKSRSVGYGAKTISLRQASQGGNDVTIPNSFEFTGRIIVVTNKPFHKIDPALKSRSLVVEVDLSPTQCLNRINRLMPYLCSDDPRATMDVKAEVLDYLKTQTDVLKKLDLRTFEQSVKEYFRSPSNWKTLVRKSIVLKSKEK